MATNICVFMFLFCIQTLASCQGYSVILQLIEICTALSSQQKLKQHGWFLITSCLKWHLQQFSVKVLSSTVSVSAETLHWSIQIHRKWNYVNLHVGEEEGLMQLSGRFGNIKMKFSRQPKVSQIVVIMISNF